MLTNNTQRRLVVFSGAGMSAESGIPTFRDANGLWENHDVMTIATPQAWESDPDLVTNFYNERRKHIIASQPNAAHKRIAKWEEDFDVRIITQNIDDLHERAGSHNVLHLHGNIRYAKSSGPNAESAYYPIDGWELRSTDHCPEGYRLRPHVVWFGEDVPNFALAADLIRSADILVVIGTSLSVYPAAGLIHFVSSDCDCYLIDPKIDAQTIPHPFHKIKAGASEGIIRLEQELYSRLGN